MNKLTNYFTVASGVFAVIPGLAVLITNVGVPPTSSKALFSAVIEALGILTLMILWLNKDHIRKKTEKIITKWAIIGIVAFVISLFSYLYLFGYLIQEVPNSESVFFPLWEQSGLKEELEIYDGDRSKLINNVGRDEVERLIIETSKNSRIFTTIIMLAIYQFIFVSLTYAFGLLAIRSNDIKPEVI